MKWTLPFLVLTFLPAVGSTGTAPAPAKESVPEAGAMAATKPAAKTDEKKPAAKVTPPAQKPSNPLDALDGAIGVNYQKGVKFGLTPEQVSAQVPGSIVQMSGDVTVLPTIVEGLQAGVHYQFHDEKLVAVLVIFDEPKGTPLEKRHIGYTEVGEKLIKRLGKPQGDECNEDKSVCDRWWSDGNNTLVQKRNSDFHGLDLYQIQMREQLVEEHKKLFEEMNKPASESGK